MAAKTAKRERPVRLRSKRQYSPNAIQSKHIPKLGLKRNRKGKIDLQNLKKLSSGLVLLSYILSTLNKLAYRYYSPYHPPPVLMFSWSKKVDVSMRFL